MDTNKLIKDDESKNDEKIHDIKEGDRATNNENGVLSEITDEGFDVLIKIYHELECCENNDLSIEYRNSKEIDYNICLFKNDNIKISLHQEDKKYIVQYEESGKKNVEEITGIQHIIKILEYIIENADKKSSFSLKKCKKCKSILI